MNNNPLDTRLKHASSLLFFWTFTWVLTIALMAFGPTFLWNHHLLLSILAVVINVFVGAAMIIANIKHLRSSDELQQKVFLDAAAITLGVGLVFGGSYGLWNKMGLISFEAEIAHLMIVMGLTFVASMIIGVRKYL